MLLDVSCSGLELKTNLLYCVWCVLCSGKDVLVLNPGLVSKSTCSATDAQIRSFDASSTASMYSVVSSAKCAVILRNVRNCPTVL